MDTPLVSICCIAFNHEEFIRDTIEGFLLQKTTFPIEIIIHDDASTDKTASIIREYEARYPHLFRPIYQTENQWKKGIRPSHKFVWPSSRGKYIALCEGDDYWTDPMKLQKQVDFLETHNDVTISSHNTTVLKNGISSLFNNQKKFISGKENEIYTARDYIVHAFFHTSSIVMRREAMWPFPDWITKVFGGDYFLVLHLSRKGSIHFINQSMSVYRINSESISNRFSRYDIYMNFRKHLNLYNDLTNHTYNREIKEKIFNHTFSIYYYHPNYFKKLLFGVGNFGRIMKMPSQRISKPGRFKIFLPTALLRSRINPFDTA